MDTLFLNLAFKCGSDDGYTLEIHDFIIKEIDVSLFTLKVINNGYNLSYKRSFTVYLTVTNRECMKGISLGALS